MTPASDDPLASQWLDALAGTPDPLADAAGNRQALALRQALQARSARLAVPEADAALFEQLQFRLRREGLTASPARRPQWPVWGLAATLLIGLAWVLQAGGYLKGDAVMGDAGTGADTLRGGGPDTLLLVADPEIRLAELLAGLRAAGATPQVEPLGAGRIRLRVAASPAVLDYLASQRIEPDVTQGQIVLMLAPPAAKR